MNVMTHPAACPYCGGTHVNQASPDVQLRHARLNDDGSITVGDVDSGVDWQFGNTLFCHTCGSEYLQPKDVIEHFDENLKVEYGLTPSKDDPAYVGATVRWVCEAVT